MTPPGLSSMTIGGSGDAHQGSPSAGSSAFGKRLPEQHDGSCLSRPNCRPRHNGPPRRPHGGPPAVRGSRTPPAVVLRTWASGFQREPRHAIVGTARQRPTLEDVSMSSRQSLPVVLVGAHGHGRWHLQNIDRLQRSGVAVHLAGVCDPRPWTPEDRVLARDLVVSARLDDVLDVVRPAITIVSTPIHTHAELAVTAARAGSEILLEKPPTPTLAGFEQLVSDLAGTGRACQVGFQSLGSSALHAVRALLADGAIGEVLSIGAAGAWQRDTSYYARARWAGRRTLDGVPVADGALTNPFAHATATALALDG